MPKVEFSLERQSHGPFERYLRRGASTIFRVQLKIDIQRIATGYKAVHGRFDEPFESRRDSTGRHAGAAGERLAFDSSLIGSDTYLVRPKPLYEIDVRPFRAERFMKSQRTTEARYIHFIGVGHK